MPKQLIQHLKLLLLLLYCIPLTAKESDKDAEIKIWADTFVANKKDNRAVYHGNVKFEQGSIKINCDRLEIVYQQQSLDTIDYISMQGADNDTANFEQLDDNNKLIRASAQKIDYVQLKNLITFKGDAELEQNNNLFKAESMLFDTAASRLVSNKTENASNKNRVFISIKPEKQ